jgi:hypothetical protein
MGGTNTGMGASKLDQGHGGENQDSCRVKLDHAVARPMSWSGIGLSVTTVGRSHGLDGPLQRSGLRRRAPPSHCETNVSNRRRSGPDRSTWRDHADTTGPKADR